MRTIQGLLELGSRELTVELGSSLEAAEKALAELTSSAAPADLESFLVPLNQLFLDLSGLKAGVNLLRSAHPSADLREACEQGERALAEFSTRLSLNRQLFERLSQVSREGFGAEEHRLVEHLERDFRRSGVDRDEATRSRIEALRAELVELGQEFSRNIREDVKRLSLAPEELEGLPEDYRRAHPAGEDGRCELTTDLPDYQPFMTYAQSADARREFYRLFRVRAWPDNESVLARILARRHELAQILGLSNWADYATEDKMIGSALAIEEFVDRVADAALERSGIEYEQLLERKRRDVPDADALYHWELSYYQELYRQEHFDVDSRQVRPYFPVAATVDGILKLSGELFGIEFRAATGPSAGSTPRSSASSAGGSDGAPRWHADVQVYDVLEGDELVGRVYLDLHPREGKYKHQAMFPLVPGVAGGAIPEAALVCNFGRPDEGDALLEHDEVVTLFHEFGHLLHHILSRYSRWAEFAGIATEWDFVEVPSQLYEEWAWDAEVLATFARHHESGEVIPQELVARLRAARDFALGLSVRLQMYYARLALVFHSRDPEAIELDRVRAELEESYAPCPAGVETHFHASFGHLEGYSALYYTYMWSLAIQKDIFSLFLDEGEGGLRDPNMAQRYRDTILACGGRKDAVELVRDFLGRDYDFEAFENWLGGIDRTLPAGDGG